MAGLFSTPKIERRSEPQQQQPPKAEDPAVQEARQKEIIAAQKQKGRAATWLTGPGGVTAPAPTRVKTLLGE